MVRREILAIFEGKQKGTKSLPSDPHVYWVINGQLTQNSSLILHMESALQKLKLKTISNLTKTKTRTKTFRTKTLKLLPKTKYIMYFLP